nr:hypothetical protein [Ningiella sp. W23]
MHSIKAALHRTARKHNCLSLKWLNTQVVIATLLNISKHSELTVNSNKISLLLGDISPIKSTTKAHSQAIKEIT